MNSSLPLTDSIDLGQIDVALLPQSLQDLAEVVGLGAALDLTRHYPGVRLYVPGIARPAHDIAGIIGFETMVKLCERYGYDYLAMPKMDSVVTQLKHHYVRQLITLGEMSNREIALSLNYSQRHAERLRSECDSTEENLDLFS